MTKAQITITVEDVEQRPEENPIEELRGFTEDLNEKFASTEAASAHAEFEVIEDDE